jgi:hypothetical protein
LPAQRSGVGLGDQVEMASMMSPGVLARPELHVALWLAALPPLAAAVIAGGLGAAQGWIGIAALGPGPKKMTAVRAGAVLAAVLWVGCQGFGGISTGFATDPGSAPLLILVAFALAVGNSQRAVPEGADGNHPFVRRPRSSLLVSS